MSEVLESVQLSPLNGTELGSRIAATVLADDLVDDDGTFRAPAQGESASYINVILAAHIPSP